MRLLYKFKAEGIWFSDNGRKAYLRGEKPKFLWPEGTDLTPTVAHHIARLKPGHHRAPGGQQYTRELVMFYKPSSP